MSKITDFSNLTYPEQLTSDVYGPDHLPKDWADMALLVPHETMRREMQRLLKSIDKLSDRLKDHSIQDWQTLWVCEYIVDVFEPFVELHHAGEEKIYFPWIASKAKIPEKKISKDHKELVSSLHEIGAICGDIVRNGGKNCNEDIEKLKTKFHEFVPEMNCKFQQHLCFL